jgi:hypothetical protein
VIDKEPSRYFITYEIYDLLIDDDEDIPNDHIGNEDELNTNNNANDDESIK